MTTESMTVQGHRRSPSDPSFTRKQIAVTFNIVRTDGATDSLTLESDYRIRGTVTHAGMSIGSELAMDIWGMSMNDMNRLSFVANQPNVENPRTINQSNSTVIVRVGDYGQPLTTLFMGQITEGFASYSNADPVFHLHAMTSTLLYAILPDPISYRGPHSVVSILSDICTAAGLQFIDHGGWDRHAIIHNAYLEGTTLQMIRKVVEHTCRGTFNYSPLNAPSNQTGTPFIALVEVWGPAYGGVTDGLLKNEIPFVSSKTGLIDYPQYSRAGVNFSCLLRPDLAYYQPLKLKSSYTPAGWVPDPQHGSGINAQGQLIADPNAPWNGYWLPVSITHEISSELQGGPWFTHVECQRTNLGEKLAIPV